MLKILRGYVGTQSQKHHTVDHQEERGCVSEELNVEELETLRVDIKNITPSTARNREAKKQQALNDRLWKDEQAPSSIRWAVELFQWQLWGNFLKPGCSSQCMGFSQLVSWTELNWTEDDSEKMERFQTDDNLELSERAIISGSRQSTFNRRVFVSHPEKLLIKTAVEDWLTPPQLSAQTVVEDWITAIQPSVKTVVEDWLTPPEPSVKNTVEDWMTPPQPSVKNTVEDWMTPPQPSVKTVVEDWMTPLHLQLKLLWKTGWKTGWHLHSLQLKLLWKIGWHLYTFS